MTYSKGRQNDIKHIALMTYFNMGRVGCELRYLYVVLSDSLYSTFYQTTKYVIEEYAF